MPPFEHIKVLPFTLEKSEKLTDHGRARLQISGWASTNAVDRSREVIEVGFFDASLERFLLTAAMPWMHDIGDPQGRWDSISPVEGKGYYVTGHVIDLGTDVDARRMAMIEEGLVRSLSVGFNAKYEPGYGDEDEERVWHWRTGGELIEVSPCTVPCNPEAGFELAKSLGMAYPVYESAKGATAFGDLPLAEEGAAWDGAGARRRMADAAGGPEEMDWGQYAKGFLWFDSGARETLGAYKLPFADVVDGELRAVWRGCVAAMSALMGGRGGGPDIPEADQERCMAHLGKYYKKFGKPMPGKAADGAVQWVAGEAAVIEELRFEEDLERATGALGAMTNIVRHWAKHGRTLTQEHRERLTTARESLAGLLEPHPTSAADAAPQGALSLPRVRGIALPHRAPVQLPRV